jgi:hypothetical protein
MGKVTETLEKIGGMNHKDLINRFKHIVRAQGVREYLGLKEDLNLVVEIRLIEEEILQRITFGYSKNEIKVFKIEDYENNI